VAYELLLPDADEDAEGLEVAQPREAPLAYVQRVTQLKLDAALKRRQCRGLPAAPVLCSDTTVALGRSILGKPMDNADAVRILSALSGKKHRVLTAVALGTDQQREQVVSISQVAFAPMSAAQIQAYVDSGEPMGKAGAYGVQGRAAAHISHLSGSYSGIMGLPMFETNLLLNSFGLGL